MFRKWMKVFAVVLALMMVMSLFSGCNNVTETGVDDQTTDAADDGTTMDEPEEPTEITIWMVQFQPFHRPAGEYFRTGQSV
jgi:ABC-type glycerol-3-phosphate transport system substrate-binding protein